MKKLRNPTTYFFEQADNIPSEPNCEIEKFVEKLLNKNKCLLCRENYNCKNRLPRILIHCGHTFCTPCLSQFYMNRRIRCPMCLKLVKKIQSLQRLPINHTVFAHLVKKEREEAISSGRLPEIVNAEQVLFGQFERVQKQAHMKQTARKYDQDSGLPFCIFHSDRVQHFYCQSHKTFGCRVCIQVGHSRSQCKITDLYALEPEKYLEYQAMMMNGQETVGKFGNDQNINFNLLGQQYDLDDDGNLIDDDSDDLDANKSI